MGTAKRYEEPKRRIRDAGGDSPRLGYMLQFIFRCAQHVTYILTCQKPAPRSTRHMSAHRVLANDVNPGSSSCTKDCGEKTVSEPSFKEVDAPVAEIDELVVLRPNALEPQARTLDGEAQYSNTSTAEVERTLRSDAGFCFLTDSAVAGEERVPVVSFADAQILSGNLDGRTPSDSKKTDDNAIQETQAQDVVVSARSAQQGTNVPGTVQLTEAEPRGTTSRESTREDRFDPVEPKTGVRGGPVKPVAETSAPTSGRPSPRKEWAAAVPRPRYSIGSAASHPHTQDPFTCPLSIGNACYLTCGLENNGTMKLVYAHEASTVKGRILGFVRITPEMAVPGFKYKNPVIVGKSIYKDASYAYSGVGALVRVARRLSSEVTLFPLPPGFPPYVVLYNFADESVSLASSKRADGAMSCMRPASCAVDSASQFKIQCPGESETKEGTYSPVLVNERCSAVAVADPKITNNVHTASRVSPAVFKLQFSSKTNQCLLIDFRLE